MAKTFDTTPPYNLTTAQKEADSFALQVAEEIYPKMQEAIAKARAAKVKLPAMNEDGNPVTHNCNLEMDAIIFAFCDALAVLNRTFVEEEE